MTENFIIDAEKRSWVEIPEGSDFPIQNLPFGIFQRQGETPRMGVAIGGHVLDVAALAGAGLLDELDLPLGIYFADSLNPLLELDRAVWRELRSRLAALLDAKDRELGTVHGLKTRALVPVGDVELLLPIKAGDYVDFYSSLHHATNLGRMFRPDGDPLLPNWRHIPIGYHGRSSSLVVSGSPVTRPSGQRKEAASQPAWGPSHKLDFELEVGFVTGSANTMGTPIGVDEAEDHIFGLLLVNDWSARGHPGLGVSATRTVPRQVLRHFRIALGRHPRCAGSLSGSRTGAGSTSPRLSPGESPSGARPAARVCAGNTGDATPGCCEQGELRRYVLDNGAAACPT